MYKSLLTCTPYIWPFECGSHCRVEPRLPWDWLFQLIAGNRWITNSNTDYHTNVARSILKYRQMSPNIYIHHGISSRVLSAWCHDMSRSYGTKDPLPTYMVINGLVNYMLLLLQFQLPNWVQKLTLPCQVSS